MKVLVCGSRDWVIMKPIMDRLSKLPKLSLVIEGGQRGVDRLARVAAETLGFDVIEVPANWVGRGSRGGPYRNGLMLDLGPELVLAFHENYEGSRGTANCVNQATKRGVPVEIVRLERRGVR